MIVFWNMNCMCYSEYLQN